MFKIASIALKGRQVKFYKGGLSHRHLAQSYFLYQTNFLSYQRQIRSYQGSACERAKSHELGKARFLSPRRR